MNLNYVSCSFTNFKWAKSISEISEIFISFKIWKYERLYQEYQRNFIFQLTTISFEGFSFRLDTNWRKTNIFSHNVLLGKLFQAHLRVFKCSTRILRNAYDHRRCWNSFPEKCLKLFTFPHWNKIWHKREKINSEKKLTKINQNITFTLMWVSVSKKFLFSWLSRRLFFDFENRLGKEARKEIESIHIYLICHRTLPFE